MKTNNVLYLSPKSEVEDLKRIVPTMPGQTTFISGSFIRNLTDEQFKDLCRMEHDFKLMGKSAMKEMYTRLMKLGIKFDIEHGTGTIKIEKS
jgi:hypothetical protein